MMRYFKMLITAWQEKAEDWSLNRGALKGHEFYRNSLLSATIEHISSPITTKIICIPVCSISVLLRFSCRIAY